MKRTENFTEVTQAIIYFTHPLANPSALNIHFRKFSKHALEKIQ